MKKIFTVLLLLSGLAYAEPFRLMVTPVGGDQIVSFNQDDWQFVAKESNYDVYIAKGELENKNGLLMIQSNTTFEDLVTYNFMEKPVRRIFSYGALDCKNKKLYLLGDMFVAEDHTVQYLQYHQMGDWISELDKEGTARNAVWKKICHASV